MEKKYLFTLCALFSMMVYAQRQDIGMEIQKTSANLYKGEPKTSEDSLSYEIMDAEGDPCATVIVLVKDDKLGDLKFGGTLGSKWKRISPKQYCLYVMDDGETEQLIIIQSTTARKEISSDSIPRFKGGRQYYIEVWEKIEGPTPPKPYKPSPFVGVGFSPVPSLSPSISVGYDFDHINVWLYVSYSLKKWDELFVYDSSNKGLGSHQYKNMRIGINGGYDFELRKDAAPIAGVMPYIGVSWDRFWSPQNDLSLDGFNSYSLNVGLRGALKTNNRRLCFYLSPEIDWNFMNNPQDNYKAIKEQVPSIKREFEINIQIGVLLYF